MKEPMMAVLTWGRRDVEHFGVEPWNVLTLLIPAHLTMSDAQISRLEAALQPEYAGQQLLVLHKGKLWSIEDI